MVFWDFTLFEIGTLEIRCEIGILALKLGTWDLTLMKLGFWDFAPFEIGILGFLPFSIWDFGIPGQPLTGPYCWNQSEELVWHGPLCNIMLYSNAIQLDY